MHTLIRQQFEVPHTDCGKNNLYNLGLQNLLECTKMAIISNQVSLVALGTLKSGSVCPIDLAGSSPTLGRLGFLSKHMRVPQAHFSEELVLKTT